MGLWRPMKRSTWKHIELDLFQIAIRAIDCFWKENPKAPITVLKQIRADFRLTCTVRIWSKEFSTVLCYWSYVLAEPVGWIFIPLPYEEQGFILLKVSHNLVLYQQYILLQLLLRHFKIQKSSPVRMWFFRCCFESPRYRFSLLFSCSLIMCYSNLCKYWFPYIFIRLLYR